MFSVQQNGVYMSDIPSRMVLYYMTKHLLLLSVNVYIYFPVSYADSK